MCLAVPMKLIKKEGNIGIVEYNGIEYNAELNLIDDVKIGDYLIIHAGFAIQKLDEQEAKRILDIFNEIDKL
jgi:hydrogenase expression/formation protein HypC